MAFNRVARHRQIVGIVEDNTVVEVALNRAVADLHGGLIVGDSVTPVDSNQAAVRRQRLVVKADARGVVAADIAVGQHQPPIAAANAGALVACHHCVVQRQRATVLVMVGIDAAALVAHRGGVVECQPALDVNPIRRVVGRHQPVHRHQAVLPEVKLMQAVAATVAHHAVLNRVAIKARVAVLQPQTLLRKLNHEIAHRHAPVHQPNAIPVAGGFWTIRSEHNW